MTKAPTDALVHSDGGGVRGLSSLVILQRLMTHINEAIRDQRRSDDTRNGVEPHEVFDLFAGTSTGGLIAIMLGKLGMTLQESIQAYHDLSKSVFGKKHIRGRITFGLARTRYSGSRLERQIQGLVPKKKGIAEAVPMVSDDNSKEVACAVVCREHYYPSKYSDIKDDAVLICSSRCHKQVACIVSEAARATSAAPTYFPVQKIRGRYFVDGGMEFNNPSHAIYRHYKGLDRVITSVMTSGNQSFVPGPAWSSDCHGGLDFSRLRVVNLGTGTNSSILPPRQQDHLSNLVPAIVKMSLFLKRNLVKFAVDSEKVAETMSTLASSTSNAVKYERFSADNGVGSIKLDKYKKLEYIENLTLEYLDTDAIQDRLRKVGAEIAMDYLSRNRPNLVIESASSTSLARPELKFP